MFDAKMNVPEAPLHRAEFEHDNCGIGAVVNIKGTKTRETVENALKIVENLEHRAGKDAEGKTGDGVGILVQICHSFFVKVTKPLGIELGDEREYGVGMFFFPQDELKRNQAKKMFEIIVEKEGLEFLGWREVPCVPTVLGHKAVECMPYIMQAFVKKACRLAPAFFAYSCQISGFFSEKAHYFFICFLSVSKPENQCSDIIRYWLHFFFCHF